MTVKTPAELKTLYESISFDLQTTYTGPLGQEYAVSGTHLRLWAPTAQRVEVSLYRKGSGGEPIGTLPLERGQQGVWSIYLPGDQHGRYYTYTVTVDGISRQTGDPYARAAGVNGTRSMIVDLARTAPSGSGAGCASGHPAGAARGVGGERARLLAGRCQRRAPGMAGQVHGLYPAGHHPARGRHPPHLPELPPASGREVCAADAHF